MKIHNRATGEVVEFSTPEEQKKARLARMRHIVWLGVKTLERVQGEDGGELTMYTLTYRGVADWQPRHISGCMRWLRGQGVSAYVWVGELQRRGAVHYHVLALLPDGVQWVKPNDSHGGWAHGFTWVTSGIEFPLYIMKYLQKGDDNGTKTVFPKGFRLYCVSRSLTRRFEFDNAVSYRRANVPRWAWSITQDSAFDLCLSRRSGGVATQGLFAYSPYARTGIPALTTLSGEACYTLDRLAGLP